jgi:hypothetical protein
MSAASLPDVSLVIVSWNTRDYLARCLRAVPEAAEKLAVEIIVVDNGSTDGTQTMLAGEFPHVQVIQNRDNIGYGRACNIGARAGRGRVLLILNSDCELQPGALSTMAGELGRDASIGMVLCRILNSDGSLQPSVHRSFPSPWDQIGELFFLSSLRYAVYRRPALQRWFLGSTRRAHRHAQDVAWGGGMCMLIRRDLFEALGGFDERFFMYCEDMDLCIRIRDAGFRIRYLPGPSAVHHWGKSTAQMPSAMLREAYRSRSYYFEKHFPGWGGSVARGMATVALTVRRVLFSLLARIPSGHRQSFQARASACQSCLQALREFDAQAVGRRRGDGGGALLLLLAVVVLFSLVRYLHDLAKFLIESPFVDFAHYYVHTTAVALGLDPFDPQAVAQVVESLKIRRAGGSAGYPPLFYVLMRPWVLVPFHWSAVAWVLTNQVLLLATLGLCLRRFASAGPVQIAAALFVVLNYQPLVEDIALGQANVLLLFLAALAWWGLREERPWTAAAAVGLMFHVKVQFGLLFPLLWWMGYPLVCARALLIAGAGLGAGLLLLGPGHYLTYVHYVFTLPDQALTWTGNLSPRATFHRLVGGLSGGPVLADCLMLALDAALLLVFARAIPRPAPPGSIGLDWSWGLGLVAVVLLSPLTEEHHLVVLLFPFTLLLLYNAFATMSLKEQAVFVGSILLLGSRYSFERFPAFHQGSLSLLTIGKLLGAAALAWVLVTQLRVRRSPTG